MGWRSGLQGHPGGLGTRICWAAFWNSMLLSMSSASVNSWENRGRCGFSKCVLSSTAVVNCQKANGITNLLPYPGFPASSPLQALTFNFVYTTPKASFLNKIENAIASGWQIGGYALYQSGQYLTPPSSPTLNFLTSEDLRVAGQPLYNVNINNIHSYNPATTQVLNPLAWTACPTNTTCTAPGTLYSDFRGPRVPSENANIGRNFRIKERMNFQIRAEFVNIFNRTLFPNPTTTNPQNPVTKTAGINSAGFGVINTFATAGSLPTTAVAPYLLGRTGTLIARFTF